MLGYIYIQELFTAILKSSKCIEGRFFVCPKWGSEMNNPSIEESIPIGFNVGGNGKYPAAMLMPPSKGGQFQLKNNQNYSTSVNSYDRYKIQMLFVGNPTTNSEGQPTQPDGKGDSSHTVIEMWHDMDRVAQNFLSTMQQLLEAKGANVAIDDSQPTQITPVTGLGDDGVSGVKLQFTLMIFSGCITEDYDDISSIIIPDYNDSHALHKNI